MKTINVSIKQKNGRQLRPKPVQMARVKKVRYVSFGAHERASLLASFVNEKYTMHQKFGLERSTLYAQCIQLSTDLSSSLQEVVVLSETNQSLRATLNAISGELSVLHVSNTNCLRDLTDVAEGPQSILQVCAK